MRRYKGRNPCDQTCQTLGRASQPSPPVKIWGVSSFRFTGSATRGLFLSIRSQCKTENRKNQRLLHRTTHPLLSLKDRLRESSPSPSGSLSDADLALFSGDGSSVVSSWLVVHLQAAPLLTFLSTGSDSVFLDTPPPLNTWYEHVFYTGVTGDSQKVKGHLTSKSGTPENA